MRNVSFRINPKDPFVYDNLDNNKITNLYLKEAIEINFHKENYIRDRIKQSSSTKEENKYRMLFVDRNLKAVIKIATIFQKRYKKLYTDNIISLNCLISAGNLGLIEASLRFDINSKNKFLGFAVSYIQSYMFREISYNNYVHINSQKKWIFKKIYNKINKSIINGNIYESYDHLFDKDELLYMDFFINQKIYLSDFIKKINEKDDLSLYDEENIDYPLNPIDDFYEQLKGEDCFLLKNEKKQEIETTINKVLLESISERDRKILHLFFGFNGNKDMQAKEISKIFNLTRERVRQIKEKCLRKLEYSRKLNQLDW